VVDVSKLTYIDAAGLREFGGSTPAADADSSSAPIEATSR
jgi:hypothetical protein